MRYIFFAFLVILGVNGTSVPLRTYRMEQDFVMVLKKAGFSVYDNSKKPIYRIESKSVLTTQFDLVVEPSKDVIGRLEAKPFSLSPNISLFNSKMNKWINGTLYRHITIMNYEYNLKFNGEEIFVERRTFPTRTRFRTESRHGAILAEFKRKYYLGFIPSSPKKFNVEIYSNTFPDELYLLIQTWIEAWKK